MHTPNDFQKLLHRQSGSPEGIYTWLNTYRRVLLLINRVALEAAQSKDPTPERVTAFIASQLPQLRARRPDFDDIWNLPAVQACLTPAALQGNLMGSLQKLTSAGQGMY